MKRLFAWPVVLFLAACAGPRPLPPPGAAVVVPDAWRSRGDAEAEAEAEVDASWWRAFGDPQLTRTVELALDHDVDIAGAVARVAEARAQFALARADRRPDLSGSGGVVRERFINAFGQPTLQTGRELDLSVSYDLDLFGRLANIDEAARAQVLATEAARESVRLVVAASAANGYINLRLLDARLDLLNRTLAARSESLRLISRRAGAGYSPMLDQRQAEAEVRATEQLIPAVRLAITKQEDGLSILLGENPRTIERTPAGDGFVPPSIPPAGVPSTLLRRRPDIAQAEAQLVAADRSLDAARAAFLPSVRLGASAGEIWSSLFLDNPIHIFSIGGSVLAPLFDGGRLDAQQDVAAARRDQAALAYRRSALNAFREVEDALAAVRAFDEQEAALAAQVEALALAYQLASNRYRDGYSPFLEQLDAERSLLATELSLVQAQADRLTARVGVYQALGGGWKAPEEERASR